MSKTEVKNQNKKMGRTRKDENKQLEEDTHSKMAEDNYIKKINSGFLQSVKCWLNVSFINDKGEFYPAQKKNNFTILAKIK